MTLNGYFYFKFCFSHRFVWRLTVRFSKIIAWILITIDLCCQRRKCSGGTIIFSGNIRFVRIFAQVLWKEVGSRVNARLELFFFFFIGTIVSCTVKFLRIFGGVLCKGDKKRGKIGPRLLLMTNRKLHTHYRLIPKSITSDDLEGPLPNLFRNTFVFRSPPRTFEWRLTQTISDEDVAQWL